jgi:signal transduction histidine kinase
VSDTAILEQLRRNTLFDGLQSAELDALLTEIPVSEVPAGTVILSEGAATESANAEIYLLLSGTVNVVRMLSEDREHAVTQMYGGDFFGETAVFTSGPRSARISAATPVTIGRVNRELLDQILIIDPMTAVRTIIRVLTRRLREANDTIITNHLRQEKLATIGSVTGQIAHDLKSPLQAVAGVADMLVDPLVKMPPQEQAAIIRRGVKSVSGLVEDILAFASDKPRRPYQQIVINDVLKNVEDFGLSQIERKGRIQIDRQIDQVPPITGDAVAIERMLLNLTKNAAEAMESGGTLTLCVHQTDGQVEMIVQDTGSGIPEEVRAKLFQSFVTSGKAGGTGLGLAMVKRTVDAHGGTIGVESAPGTGTKFTIRIPCVPSQNAAATNALNPA